MNLRRIIIALLFCLFSSISLAADEPDLNPGIAFVHGTSDHREDAYGIYWKVDFIESVAQGLKNPKNFFVVHCDFSQYMWHGDASVCVANQLLEFINEHHITSLMVYTHSNGGNVVRFILSNPTYDPRFQILTHKIKQVIALAPSSGGTPLADEVLSGGVFSNSIAWLLGYKTDAVKQQRVADMLIYNQELLFGTPNRPDLLVPFRVIVGTDVVVSPLNSSSYCNGFLNNSGLKLAKLYLAACSDGFLNCSSQALAGKVWFRDVEKTGEDLPLNHNQSRHSCFGLDKILIDDIEIQGMNP